MSQKYKYMRAQTFLDAPWSEKKTNHPTERDWLTPSVSDVYFVEDVLLIERLVPLGLGDFRSPFDLPVGISVDLSGAR